MLLEITDFLDNWQALIDQPVTYWYEGICPKTGQLLRLPRTPLVEAIAYQLMRQLEAKDEYFYRGKMYGILLVKTPDQQLKVLKAFSGLAIHSLELNEWVSMISGKDQIILEEKRTVAKLEEMKEEIAYLQTLPEGEDLKKLQEQFEQALQIFKEQQAQAKLIRQEKREYFQQNLTGMALKLALEELNNQSYDDSKALKKFKDTWKEKLQPLQDKVTEIENQIKQLKARRKSISRHLQGQLFQAYSLTNFSGESRSIDSFMNYGGFPTGTGECCAPKLLHYAAIHQLIPLGMAEFWWGKDSKDKVSGQFYGACRERCQPLMGFLLSGLSLTENSSTVTDKTLTILYEDPFLIAVNKPTGLLSTPGRYFETQDSVLSRLRHQYEDGMNFRAIHRLDQDTSGILLIARNGNIQNLLSQQFRQRNIHKVYEALLAGIVKIDQGIIKLPLWGDPNNRPYQRVNDEKGKGKRAITQFKVMERQDNLTRIEFIPLTGRTHQLRVHAADKKGLGTPILGDHLYGSPPYSRLCLHAKELGFIYPNTQEKVILKTETPF
jgi:tRNA pseudouridine32 synthase/23S rRNA pseudouridine746 synthase